MNTRTQKSKDKALRTIRAMILAGLDTLAEAHFESSPVDAELRHRLKTYLIDTRHCLDEALRELPARR